MLLWNAYQELGARWVDVSTKYFKSQRSENQIKNRWNSARFKKFVTEEIDPNAKTGATWSVRKDDQRKRQASSSLLSSVIVAPRYADTDVKQRTVLLKDTRPLSSPPPLFVVGRPAGRKRLSKRKQDDDTEKWRGVDDSTSTN
jgi:hypothetical protein